MLTGILLFALFVLVLLAASTLSLRKIAKVFGSSTTEGTFVKGPWQVQPAAPKPVYKQRHHDTNNGFRTSFGGQRGK